MRYHDPRAEKIIALIQEAEKRNLPEDPILDHHLNYGGLHPTEAFSRLQMSRSRAEIHHAELKVIRESQLEQAISCIYWVRVDFWGKSVELPEKSCQLTCREDDKMILMSAKPSAIKFIEHFRSIFKIWRRDDSPNGWELLSWEIFLACAEKSDWLQIDTEDSISRVISLDTGEEYDRPSVNIDCFCCWGDPNTYQNIDGYPDSGATWFQLNNFTPDY